MSKKAILVISFGTSYHETREKTIDACENKIRENFKGYDFFRAYTSRMIIKKLKTRDEIFIDNEEEALDRLYEMGYEEVIIQPLHIICGDEYHKIKNKIESYKNKFKKIELGRPLLTTIDDYQEVVEAIKHQLPKMDENECVVFMGHGTFHESHSAYPAIEYMMRHEDMKVYMGTVEGYPEIDHVIKKLRRDNIKKINLMPFMLVAGDHAINDMASDEEDSWKTVLENEGFEVETHIIGLGENPHIQDKFVRNAKDLVENVQESAC